MKKTVHQYYSSMHYMLGVRWGVGARKKNKTQNKKPKIKMIIFNQDKCKQDNSHSRMQLQR